jgi:predicted ATPase
MAIQAFRVQNFMGFEDSGWIEFRLITLLFGRNSTGKSALLRALLLLRQSLSSRPEDGPLLFAAENGFDFGGYSEMVRGHVLSRQMSFWFQCVFSQDSEDPWNILAILKKLGVELLKTGGDSAKTTTITFRLIYGRVSKKKVALRGVDIFDDQGDLLLRATSQNHVDSLREPWEFVSEFFKPEEQPEPNLWPALEMFMPVGFLPDFRSVEGKITLPNNYQKNEKDSSPDSNSIFENFVVLFRTLRSEITTFFKGLEYLEPLRPEPQRFYDTRTQGNYRLGMQSQRIVRILLDAQQNPAMVARVEDINKWLAESRFKVSVEINPIDKNEIFVELLVTELNEDTKAKSQVNILEVGFGISQVLPVVVQTLLASENSIILIEQPELHLHPSAQAELGDLFIQVAKQHNVRLIIETHSEHLLLRLRRRIAETTAKMITASEMLNSEDVKLYYVDKVKGKSISTPVEIDDLGSIVDPSGRFKNFFADDAREVFELTKAAIQAKAS